jgi:hypothetical protein
VSVTYQSALNDLRARLDEKGVARFWADAQLISWIAQGCRDVARRSETLWEYNTGIAAVPSEAEYALPGDVLRLHRIEYVPQASLNPVTVYPLMLSNKYEMDQRWGAAQYLQSIYPTWAVIRGTPGNPRNNGSSNLIFQVYPVPSQAGVFRVDYFALPNGNPATTDNLEVSGGYEDLPLLWAEAIALRSDRDPRWQESRQLYEQDLAAMIDMTRQLHDQSRQMVYSGVGGSGYAGAYGYDSIWGGL